MKEYNIVERWIFVPRCNAGWRRVLLSWVLTEDLLVVIWNTSYRPSISLCLRTMSLYWDWYNCAFLIIYWWVLGVMLFITY
jgi:hypothetical protein